MHQWVCFLERMGNPTHNLLSNMKNRTDDLYYHAYRQTPRNNVISINSMSYNSVDSVVTISLGIYMDNKQLNHHLLHAISDLIEKAKKQAAQQVNSTLVMLHWEIGREIHQEVLKEERAEYGEHVIKQ